MVNTLMIARYLATLATMLAIGVGLIALGRRLVRSGWWLA